MRVPLVILDRDAILDDALTPEERMALATSAADQLKAAGYFPMFVKPGSRVEVLGVGEKPGAESKDGFYLVRVDADAVSPEDLKALREHVVVVVAKAGSVVERV